MYIAFLYQYLISYPICQYNMKTGDVNIVDFELSDTAFMYHKILRSDIQRTVWLSVRIDVLNLELKGLNVCFPLRCSSCFI